jgi:ABC-type transport system involved in multi-copper enzyme maturation permease subunit
MVGVGFFSGLVVLGLVYLALKTAFPKVAAIAYATSVEGVKQPLFLLEIVAGFVAIFFITLLPYFTFGEDDKMVKDTGLTVILVLGIILALWTASKSISEEVEGRTALTLLSKPISRLQFVLGKFLGILGPVFLLFLVLSIPYFTSVSYMVVSEAKETGKSEPKMEECRDAIVQIAPGLVLSFLEAVVMTSVSVAISTRLTTIANLLVCAVTYALGHLVPLLVQSSVAKGNAIVEFVGQLSAAVLPVLDHFNVQAAVSTGSPIPYSYVGMTFLYCVLYSSMALLAALFLFEDRDLG